MFVVLSVKAETQLDLLIPGLSHHTAEPEYIDEFNEVNYGLGVRYRIQNTNYEYDFSTMVLKDSYNHLMATATYGVNYYLFKNEDLNVRVGGSIGLGYRKMLYVYDTYSYFEYNIVPLMSPSLSIDYKSVADTTNDADHEQDFTASDNNNNTNVSNGEDNNRKNSSL